MPAQPLGTQLDRRQRILDFVGEAPRHLAPGRDLLSPDERCDIIEHQHRPFRRAPFAGQRRRRDRQVQLPAFARQRDFLRQHIGLGARGDKGGHRLQIRPRKGRLHRMADDRPIQIEQPGRRAVDGGHEPRRVHRHDARRDSLQNRFYITSSSFDFLMLPLQLDGRPFNLSSTRDQLAGHGIESVDERPELVVRLRFDALVEPTGANLTRRRRQHLNGTRDPLGQVQARPG